MADGSIDKCVILARGLGTRMRRDDRGAALDASQAAAADAGLKAMIPIGRPFLDYVLSALADAGFARACLVIGPGHDRVRDYYAREQRPTRIGVEFAVQAEPRGTADALLAAEPFAGAAEFVSLNADNYYPIDVLRQLRTLGEPGTVLFDADSLVRESNIPAERVRDFAYVELDPNGFVTDLIEKPGATAPAGRLVSMNCWRFGPEIFEACRRVPLSPRGELELPLAVGLAVGAGLRLRAVVSHAGVLDLSRRSDVEAVAARLRGVEISP